jgi:AraC family transcriptional activator of pobA
MRSRAESFFLYGEPPREAVDGFLHVETIADRSRLYDWKIRPHAHRNLHQLLLILAGNGEMRVESEVQPFKAPALLIVPATVVHAFAFERDTRGYVITLAEQSLRDLAKREPAFRTVFSSHGVFGIEASGHLEDAARGLLHEVVWDAPARAIAAEARLITVLVSVVRALAEHAVRELPERGPRAALVTRFRDAIEANFRSGWDVAKFAKVLRVSPSRLRAACLDVTGKPPTRLVHDRLLLEAKRSLTYTNMTIAETAYDLGFTDPAYFSRFFSERAGESPAAFRRRTAATE